MTGVQAGGEDRTEKMFELILRSTLYAPDVTISGNASQFERSLFHYLDQVRNTSTPLHLADPYLLARLVNCTLAMEPLTPGHCPRIFDSWTCFQASQPGAMQAAPCPDFPLLQYARDRQAYKWCDEGGQWWVHPDSNRTWSNYTNCVDYQDLWFRNSINTLSITGLSLSLAFLLLSLITFSSFPSLCCPRVSMHKHLILSLLCSSTSWLLWYHLVIFDKSVWSSNILWCRALHVITTYFTLTTYTWMLCEGAYIYTILVAPFIDHQFCVSCLIILGWTAPVFFIIPYVIYRQRNEDFHCWMDMGDSNWFIAVPVILVILLNIIFLFNVIRIIRGKLRSISEQNRADNKIQDTMKQARAVMFLVPILGINFMLLPIRPAQDSSMEYFYEILSVVSSSFQGVFVSLLLCFTNSQVLQQIKLKFYHF